MPDRKQDPTTAVTHTKMGSMGVYTSKKAQANMARTRRRTDIVETASPCTQVQVITSNIPVPCPRVCITHSLVVCHSSLATRSCILKLPHAPPLPTSISRTATKVYHMGLDPFPHSNLCGCSRSQRHRMGLLGRSCWKHSFVNQVIGIHQYDYGRTSRLPPHTPFPARQSDLRD